MRIYAIVNLRTGIDHPPGETVDVFLRREDAERFVEEVRADEPELAGELKIVERDLNVGPSLN